MERDPIQERLKVIKVEKETLTNQLLMELSYLKSENIHLNIDINSSGNSSEGVVDIEKYLALKNQVADKDFLTSVLPKISDIPKSNGTRFFNRIDVNIGIICDEFLFKSYEDVANFYYVKKDEYEALSGKLDVLIVASTWRGLNEDWKGFGNPNNVKVRNDLFDLINFFRNQGVKIVFYSKEDPTNYHRFVDIAKRCDYIFTTAIEKIADYKNDCNNDQVFPLEFSVNPIYNNPIGINNTVGDMGAIFAGSWYEKYPNRKADSRTIFDGVIAAGKQLKIIDRNFDKNLPNHFFPPEYLQYISPSIEHSTLQKLFKIFPWTINLNSVQNSETMFANRVYELQAMGNLILSNYSLGINNLFPNIFIIQNSNELDFMMNNLSENDLYLLRMYGVRSVLKEHTSFHRINTLLNNIGFEKNYVPSKKVAVIVNDKQNEIVLENFNRQTYQDKELVLLDGLHETYDTYDYVTFFNDGYDYGEYYLEDLVNGFKYTNSSYITKDSYYEGNEKIQGIEHNFVQEIKDKYRTLFTTSDFKLSELVNTTEPTERENGYSIDSLEINVKRLNHTEEKSMDLQLSVIIPVYNNGQHLYGKCFMSLLRSTMFKNMDIILVDDGSTDNTTLNMVDRLERLYPNVQVYKFNDGGSGSASRPRNKGIELAKTDYITYLDPDNEAVNDGYFQLFNELQKDTSIDLVVGDIIKYDTKQKVLNYSKNAFKWDSNGIVTDTYEFLKESNMRAQSIQALIVKKEIIENNNLIMVEKAAGQDTLFFQELILHCSKIKAIDLVIHLYYAAVTNSVTNTISKKFFKKYLLLERERYVFLEKNNLLKIYVTGRFASYFVGWYLSRVPRIKRDDMEEGLEVLYEIYQLYKPLIRNPVEPLSKFERLINNKQYEEFVSYCEQYFDSRG
ncbi:glycosyl transferase family 2 [Oceanobacillus arenosus]|uniref:Glycosyl transferase family 2 n=1 Tax=Oceanobacillus arenosus TaxID=1229153 RepID=A0A3D8Q2Q1_9BACI|nr:glycosyltransferase [Oceanobacillus arenosus]RDW22217.1 glycosyl transferase family 2 [Oceanobacillus arenosus]